jgi:hypothetical protein
MGACHMVKGYFVKEVMETCKKQLTAKPSWNTSTTARALSAPYRLIAKNLRRTWLENIRWNQSSKRVDSIIGRREDGRLLLLSG